MNGAMSREVSLLDQEKTDEVKERFRKNLEMIVLEDRTIAR